MWITTKQIVTIVIVNAMLTMLLILTKIIFVLLKVTLCLNHYLLQFIEYFFVNATKIPNFQLKNCPFSIYPASGTIPPGEFLEFSVKFFPLAVSEYTSKFVCK